MKEKIIKLLTDYVLCQKEEDEVLEEVANLLANGVTVQTTPIPYERLLKIAKNMHFWIWDHSFDEQEVYDQLGLTEEENYILGYGGSFKVVVHDAPKEADNE